MCWHCLRRSHLLCAFPQSSPTVHSQRPRKVAKMTTNYKNDAYNARGDKYVQVRCLSVQELKSGSNRQLDSANRTKYAIEGCQMHGPGSYPRSLTRFFDRGCDLERDHPFLLPWITPPLLLHHLLISKLTMIALLTTHFNHTSYGTSTHNLSLCTQTSRRIMIPSLSSSG